MPTSVTEGEDIQLGKEITKNYLYSNTIQLNGKPIKLGIRVKSYTLEKIPKKRFDYNVTYYHELLDPSIFLRKIQGDYSVFKESGQYLIPRAIANAAGFINYFFRGSMKAKADNCAVTITNDSNVDLVADASVVTFEQNGTIELYYDDVNDGQRKALLKDPYKLTQNLLAGKSLSIPIYPALQSVINSIKDRKLTVVYTGVIGKEESVSVTVVELPDTITDEVPMPKKGTVEVSLLWENTATNLDLKVEWNAGELDIKDTACGMEHFYVEDSNIATGTYPVYITYQEKDDELILDSDAVSVMINTPDKSEIYKIDIKDVKKLKEGHLADIHIKLVNDELEVEIKPDKELPPPVIVSSKPSVDKVYTLSYGSSGRYYSSGGGGGGGSYNGCSESCGCIPCEYIIIPYLQQALCGPISGADIELYEAVDYQNKIALHTGKTTSGDTLYTAGNIEIPNSIVDSLEDEKLYLLIVNGGVDIDYNDDFDIDSTPTPNYGELHLLLTGKDIKEIGFKANVLTEIAYQIVKDMIDSSSTKEIQDKLNEVALRVLVDKVYSDTNGTINYQDLSFWLPTVHKDLLVADYDEMIAPLVENLFANRDIYQEAYNVVYLPNDTKPTLQSKRYDISEDIGSGNSVGDIVVLNEGKSEIISFNLEGEGEENFSIDSNGKIIVSQNANLDYETKTYYKLYVSASNDSGTSKEVLIIIQLKNIIDSPELKNVQTFALYKNTPIDSEALKVEFHSEDLESAILSGGDSKYFKVEIIGNNNVIITVAKSLLDKYKYRLILQVSTATQSSELIPLTFELGERVGIPILENTSFIVDDNATAGTIIGQVDIISYGGNSIIGFTIESDTSYPWPKNYFEIDNNGIIRIGNEVDFNYKNSSLYVAKVKAINISGESEEVYVKIAENRIGIPILKGASFSITEDTVAGDIIGKIEVVSEGGSPITEFKLSSMDSLEIDIEGTIRMGSGVNNLDYEKNRYLTAGVQATNASGESQEVYIEVSLSLEDRIGVPILKNTSFSVEENATMGDIIGQVKILSDGGSPIIEFKVEPENYLMIDKNATVHIGDSNVFDYEKSHYYSAKVKAINDFGESSEKNIDIYLIDIAEGPILEDQYFYIEENAMTGDIIGKINVISDGGSPIVEFKVEPENYLIIDNNGTIRIGDSNIFDYEESHYYNARVKVINSLGESSEVNINIYLIDMAEVPILKDKYFDIEENATAGTIIGKINIMSDGGSPIIKFKVESNSSNQWAENYFIIDSNGTISLSSSANLDYESYSSYETKVKAINAIGESNEVNLGIYIENIFDTLPSFEYSKPIDITIYQNTNIGQKLHKLHFNSGDSHIISARIEPESPFGIDIDNYITLESSLSNINTLEYNLSAIVTNSLGDSTKQPINITVNTDPNKFSVLEGTFDTVIGELYLGYGIVKRINIPDSENKYFKIDSNGTISTASASENVSNVLSNIDKEQHSFMIEVEYQNGDIHEIQIIINIKSRILSKLDITSKPKKMILNKSKNKLYITTSNGLNIIDVSDENNPTLLYSLSSSNYTNDLVLSDNEQYIYFLSGGNGIKVIDIIDDSSPHIISSFDIYGYNIALSSNRNFAFISYKDGVKVIDVSNPYSLTLIKDIGFMGDIVEYYFGTKKGIIGSRTENVSVSSDGNKLYIADSPYGLQVIDISDIQNPILVYPTFSPSTSENRYSESVTMYDEKGLIFLYKSYATSIYNTYNINDVFKIHKFTKFNQDKEVKIINQGLAYSSKFKIFDFYNPMKPKILAYIPDLSQYDINSIILNKDKKIMYTIHDDKLNIINLEGIEQPNHISPVILDTAFDILESQISSLNIGDILGKVKIYQNGDTPIQKTWLEEFSPENTETICALDKDDNSNPYCSYLDEHHYYNIGIDGILEIDSTQSSIFNTTTNQIIFAAYTQNENNHKSNQAKVTINIKEDNALTLKFKRSSIYVDRNIAIDLVGNIFEKQSKRELYHIGVYNPIYKCNRILDYYKGYLHKQTLEANCEESILFGIDSSGNIFTKDILDAGSYKIHIVAIDRFGFKTLKDQTIKISE